MATARPVRTTIRPSRTHPASRSSRLMRRQRIIEQIAGQGVISQQELLDRLAADGIVTTQATLSRDLHELGVSKGPGGYVLPDTPGAPSVDGPSLDRALRRTLISVDRSAATVVLRTPPGHANGLALEIDRAQPEGVVGTIAGDDTVFVATASVSRARDLVRRFGTMAGQP